MAKQLTQTPATKIYVLFVEETPHGGWEWESYFHSAYATREKAQEARKALAAKASTAASTSASVGAIRSRAVFPAV